MKEIVKLLEENKERINNLINDKDIEGLIVLTNKGCSCICSTVNLCSLITTLLSELKESKRISVEDIEILITGIKICCLEDK